LSLTLSGRLFVTDKLQIDSSFLFLGGIEPFLAVSSPCGTLQNVVLRFLIYAPNAQNLLPQIFGTKSPISRLVWQIDRRCLSLKGSFRGWPIQRIHAKCCGADPCCHGNEIWARHGDPVAYRLVILSITPSTLSFKTQHLFHKLFLPYLFLYPPD